VKPTPYGEWKLHWQVGKPIVEGLLYIVEHGVQLSEHVKVEGHLHVVDHVLLSEHVEMFSVPVEHDE